MSKTHVVCFGNSLQGDDGFGIHLLRRAQEQTWPDEVEFFDAGISGYRALNFFENCDHVVIIDAMNFESEEGRLHWLNFKDLELSFGQFSMHAVDLTHLFYVLPLVIPSEKMPKIDILAVEIKKIIPFSEKLTPPIENALGQALGQLSNFLRS